MNTLPVSFLGSPSKKIMFYGTEEQASFSLDVITHLIGIRADAFVHYDKRSKATSGRRHAAVPGTADRYIEQAQALSGQR